VFAATMQITRVAEVYRQGGGVPWDAYGDAMSWSQGDANRPLLLHALATEWVPQIPALQQRLTAGGKVADVASSHGWSSVGLALAFPEIEVHGYDMDPVAIDAAQRNAEDCGVADGVHFHLAEITGPLPHGPFEAAIAIECIHDMPYPVDVLSALRASCVDDAVVVVIDEAADPDLSTPGDAIQRLLYGFSLLICLPESLSHPGSVGTGTLIRPAVMDEYARAAGFAGATTLEVADTGFWRCYRLPLAE
jgi:hypothetical protein